MNPTISTSRVSASWTTAGTRPWNFEKSIVVMVVRVVARPRSAPAPPQLRRGQKKTPRRDGRRGVRVRAFQPLLFARTSTGPVVAFVAHVVERMIAVEEQRAKHWVRRYPEGPPVVNRQRVRFTTIWSYTRTFSTSGPKPPPPRTG